MKLSGRGTIVTTGLRFVARHIEALTDGLVPATGQGMVEMGIVRGYPQGTYGRLAARSGMGSKMRIAVGGGVIDPDYTGEVKTILQNQGQADCSYKAWVRRAQLLVERIAKAEAMEVEDVGTRARGKKGFRLSDLNPKRSIRAKEEGIHRWFVHAERGKNEFFSLTDMGYYRWLI